MRWCPQNGTLFSGWIQFPVILFSEKNELNVMLKQDFVHHSTKAHAIYNLQQLFLCVIYL